MKKKAKLLIGIVAMSLGLTACSDDYFDAEAYDSKLKAAFPVDDVDPDHTWATSGTATLNVTVNGDYGKSYRVAAYLQNPLFNKTVTILSSDSIVSGQKGSMTFSYPMATPNVYVTCFDEKNHMVVKSIALTNGATIDMNFFGESQEGAALAASRQYQPTRYFNFGTRAGQTRAGDQCEEMTDGPWDIGPGSGGVAVAMSNEAKNLLKSGNYLGFVAERKTDQSWYSSWNVIFQDAWSANNFLTEAQNVAPEGKHIYELQLASDVNLSDGGLIVKGNNVIVSRIYISEYSRLDDPELLADATVGGGDDNQGGGDDNQGSGDDSQGGGDDSQGGGESTGGDNQDNYDDSTAGYTDSWVAPSFTNVNNTNMGKYSTTVTNKYIKARVNRLNASDWVNPTWISTKLTVNMSTIDTDTDAFKELTASAISNNLLQNDNRTRKWWRIASGTTLNNGINQKICDDQNTLNRSVVYIKGKLAMSANDASQQRVTWIVGNGGELVINQNVSFTELSRIVVLEGGTLTIGNNVTVQFSGKDRSIGFYNAGNVTFPNKLSMNGVSEGGASVIYNVGTLTLNSLESVRSIYNYGTINFNEDFTLANDGSDPFNYNFYNQGICNFDDVVINTYKDCVNYGKMTGKTLGANNASYLYNGGTISTDNIAFRAIYNFGSLETDEDTYNDRREIVNGCYLHYRKGYTYDDQKATKLLILLKNSRMVVDGGFYLIDKNVSYMEDKAMLECQSFGTPTNCSIDGPAGAGEFAVIKVKGTTNAPSKIKTQNYSDMTFTGNLYFDWDNAGNAVDNMDFTYLQTINGDGSKEANVDYVMNQVLKNFLTESSAPTAMTIPEGDCTDGGYQGVPEVLTPPVEEPMSYRFCFEDNFPVPGDYDFNDCVITVTPVVNGKTVTLTVSLDAVGATKQIAAMIGVLGVRDTGSDRNVVSVSCTDNMDNGWQGFELIPSTSVEQKGTNAYGLKESAKGYYDGVSNQLHTMYLRLFNDAHYAISGSTDRLFYNTVADNVKVDYKRSTSSRTVTYTIVLKDENTAKNFNVEQNIDVFIVAQSWSGIKWEIHKPYYKWDQVLREWYGPEKLTAYKTGPTSNYPWGLCIPGKQSSIFRYPIEWNSISGSKIESTDVDNYGYTPAAYTQFKRWASNHNAATDWYEDKDGYINRDAIY